MFWFATYKQIDSSIATLDVAGLTNVNSVQPPTFMDRVQRVVTVYRPLIPLLMVLSNVPFFPASWRAAITILVQALDALASSVPVTPGVPVAPGSPVTASATSDTTTTDPLGTDPSFKAGKDL